MEETAIYDLQTDCDRIIEGKFIHLSAWVLRNLTVSGIYILHLVLEEGRDSPGTSKRKNTIDLWIYRT